MVIPLSAHSPGAARKAYSCNGSDCSQRYTDLGREFLAAFESGAEHDSTFIDPSALEMPTRRGITERAGRSFKEVLSKTIIQTGCNGYEEWTDVVVDIVNMTCNRLMNKSGYSLIQKVIRYTPRVPGGLMTGGANDLATLSRCRGDLQVQRAAELCLAAAKAFHEADAEQALGNALHGGHRVRRDFEVCQYILLEKGNRRAEEESTKFLARSWQSHSDVTSGCGLGVFQWVCRQSRSRTTSLGIRRGTFHLTDSANDITGTRDELEKQPRQRYLDLTQFEFPKTEDFDQAVDDEKLVRGDPRFRLNQETAIRDVSLQEDPRPDMWRIDKDHGLLHRVHRQPRELRFQPEEAIYRNAHVSIQRIRIVELLQDSTSTEVAHSGKKTLGYGRTEMKFP